MPFKPPHPCNAPGCPNLTVDRYCEEHRNKDKVEHDKTRGTAAQRGYDAKWRKSRRRFLRRNPLCVECLKENMVTPATDVDHIITVEGQTDPLFWDETNWQPLCHSHHSTKTAKERGFAK